MFSKATEYALRASIYIAQKSSEGKKLSITEISQAIGSPKPFTAKVMQQLTQNGELIRSSTGPRGGFYMPESAKALPVKTILKLMGESQVLDRCVLGLHECSDKAPCPMHHRYKTIKHQLIELFSTETIGSLAEGLDAGLFRIQNKID